MTPTVHIVDVPTDGTEPQVLLTVAIPHRRDAARLLGLIISAANRTEGWRHAARMLALEAGDDVMCEPMPMALNDATGLRCWSEIRFAFIPARDDPIAPHRLHRQLEESLRERGVEPDPNFSAARHTTSRDKPGA